MAAESSTHLWDICGVRIEAGDEEYTDPFDGKFGKHRYPHDFCAWAWEKVPEEGDYIYFRENNFPDGSRGYGILCLYNSDGYVLLVPVLPSQEEVAEWLKPKFPYPICPEEAESREKKRNKRGRDDIIFCANFGCSQDAFQDISLG